MLSKIGIWGNASQGTRDGYGYAGYNLCKALNEMGIQTFWEDETAPVALSFKQPIGYGGNKNQIRVGYTPWESTVVPQEWIGMINTRDLFWTTSNWCKEVFAASGVTVPIEVVNHGLNPEDFTLSKRSVDGPFVFFHMGEPADRKNGQMVFDAFRKVFGKKEDVHLVFKAHAYLMARWKDGEHIIGEVTDHPRVLAYRGVIDVKQLNAMMQGMHCLVYPSNGEGFGLIPFQAIGTGMPTILPAYSGMADFARYGINVDFTVGPSMHDYHEGEWCWPSFDDLCDKMLYVYENYDSVSEKAYEDAIGLREEFSWQSIMTQAVGSLQEKFSSFLKD
jgi:glycosyltransferase involved in cell wall biosynthesis